MEHKTVIAKDVWEKIGNTGNPPDSFIEAVVWAGLDPDILPIHVHERWMNEKCPHAEAYFREGIPVVGHPRFKPFRDLTPDQLKRYEHFIHLCKEACKKLDVSTIWEPTPKSLRMV